MHIQIEIPFKKLLRAIESNGDKFFSKIFAVHLQKGIKGLFLRLILHEYSQLSCKQIDYPFL